MASHHDDPEVVIKKEVSSEERMKARQREAEENDEVLDVGSDSDEAAPPPTKRVKTEPKAKNDPCDQREAVALACCTHGSFDPVTLAHVEMAKAVKAHLEATGEFEVKEFVFATTKNSYVQRKNKSYLDGRDRERLITIAAKEQGLDWVRAVDGSGANSGTEFIDDHFIPTGDWRTLKVEGSDTACRYGRKPGKCVVILRTKETPADVKRKRPGAIIVPGLGGALGDLSSTKVRNARDPAVVARFCGPAVAKAMASMTRHGSAQRRR